MKIVFTLVALTCAITASFAAPQGTQLPAAFDGLVKAGATVVKSFPVGDGLTGWVVRHPGGDHMVTYTTSGGQYMIAGAVFDKTGSNLTQEHVAAQVPQKDFSELVPDLRRAPAIVVGPASEQKGTLYVFTDPNCTYCAQAYRALKPHAEAGLQIRYLPVAILGPTSSTKNETILSSADPVAALDEAGMRFPNGVTAAAKVSEKTAAALKSNLDLMQKFELRGTPGIVYLNKGKPVVTGGLPQPHELRRIVTAAQQ
jgi:thiol:disulfide interchange protein DsbG